jgi:hypothetical protein
LLLKLIKKEIKLKDFKIGGIQEPVLTLINILESLLDYYSQIVIIAVQFCNRAHTCLPTGRAQMVPKNKQSMIAMFFEDPRKSIKISLKFGDFRD